jgi:hypothetical protein
MQADPIRSLQEEIDLLHRRYAVLLRELPAVRELPVRWAVTHAGICWFVPLEEVLEPDIDVEIESEVLVVRAPAPRHERVTLLGILPVPHGFDPEPVIRFLEGTLQVRIRRIEEEA